MGRNRDEIEEILDYRKDVNLMICKIQNVINEFKENENGEYSGNYYNKHIKNVVVGRALNQWNLNMFNQINDSIEKLESLRNERTENSGGLE